MQHLCTTAPGHTRPRQRTRREQHLVGLHCGCSPQTPQPGRARGPTLDHKSSPLSLLLGVPDYQSSEPLGSKVKTAVLLSSHTSMLHRGTWGVTTHAADTALGKALQPPAASTHLLQLLPITQPRACSWLIIILTSQRRGDIVFSSVLQKIKACGNLVHPGQQCFAVRIPLCCHWN